MPEIIQTSGGGSGGIIAQTSGGGSGGIIAQTSGGGVGGGGLVAIGPEGGIEVEPG
jgi:hypothetical protein